MPSNVRYFFNSALELDDLSSAVESQLGCRLTIEFVTTPSFHGRLLGFEMGLYSNDEFEFDRENAW